MVNKVNNNTSNQVWILQILGRAIEPVGVLQGMLDPSPTHHLASFKFEFSCFIMFLQNQEWWGLGEHSYIEHLGKYLDLRVFASKDWGFGLILQNQEASMDWLINLNFLRPIPPSDLFIQTVSQFNICIFLTP